MNQTRKNLRTAINSGSINRVKSLIRTEQDKRIIFNDGTTPLMRAAEKGNYELINYLVNVLKVDKKVQDKKGKVALDYLSDAILAGKLSKNIMNRILKDENQWGNLLDPKKRSRTRKNRV